MKRWRSLLLSLGAVLGVTLLGLYIYGSFLPSLHKEVLTVDLDAPPERVWRVITAYEEMPTWWDELKSVEEVARPNGDLITVHTNARGQKVPFETMEQIPNTRLVRRVVDDDLPYGGTWTFELSERAPGKTRLVVTEEAFLRGPLFRAVAQLFFGWRKTLESFAHALTRKVNAGF